MSNALLLHAPRRPSVRLLLIAWALWLLVAWATQWTTHGIGPAAVRGLMFAAAIGMLAVWPAARLSQLSSVGGVLLDWLALNALWQAVIWPMMSMMRWPIGQAVWLGVGMAAWSLWAGWIIATAGRWHGGRVRTAAMGLCVALLIGEPAVMAVTGGSWRMIVSPVGALWALTEPAGYFEIRPWAQQLMLTAVLAAGAWAALLVGLSLKHRLRASRSDG